MVPQQSQQQFNQFNQPDPRTTKVGNELGARRPGEKVIFEVQRHPIGIIGIYATITVMTLVIAILGLVVFPSSLESSGNKTIATEIGAVVFFIMFIFAAVIGVVANKVYWANKWVLTTDSVTQIRQTSLFNRDSSQIGLANVENVTANQKGILQQLFKYGTITTDTAGQVENFVFPFCPNPNYYATRILEAREAFEATLHSGDAYSLHHVEPLYDPNTGSYIRSQPNVGQPMPPEPQGYENPVTNPVPPTITTTQEDQDSSSSNFKSNY